MLAFDIDFFVCIVVHGGIYKVNVCLCSRHLTSASTYLLFSPFLFSLSLPRHLLQIFLPSTRHFDFFIRRKNVAMQKYCCHIWCVLVKPPTTTTIKTEKIYTKRDRWWTKAEWRRETEKKNCISFTFEYNIWCISNAFFTSSPEFFGGVENLCTQLFTMSKCSGFVIYI